MLKTAFIAPTSLIREYGSRGDVSLALAHLLPDAHEEENLYEHVIRDIKLPIILDNGVFENGVSIDPIELAWKAAGMKAEVVFAPDVLYDTKGTYEESRRFLEILRTVNKEAGTNVKMGVVVQADNVNDYIIEYKRYARDENVALIGLSILSIPKSYGGEISDARLTCLKTLLNNHPDEIKQSHLLGAGNHFRDVDFANRMCPFVVSHDSSSAIWNGLHYKMIDPDTLEVVGGKEKTPVDFEFDGRITDENRRIIEHNINIIRKITGHESSN